MAFSWVMVCVVLTVTAGFADSVAPEKQVLLLLDISESMKDSTSEISDFIQMFYSVTSDDAFFLNHNKRKVTVATFNEGLISGEEWVVDYSQYNNAAELRAAEEAEVANIVSTIDAKEASGLTNIGLVLDMAREKYSLNQNWVVILVSDFVNRKDQPPIREAVGRYSYAYIKIVPVIVDKEIRDETTYTFVRDVGGYGIDFRDGLTEENISPIYNDTPKPKSYDSDS